MRILYLSPILSPRGRCYPDPAYEMARGLVRAGHHVTMITEVPNHPEGIIRPEYRGRFYFREVLMVWKSCACG